MLRHTNSCPALVMAQGDPNVLMYRGNFRITDQVAGELVPRSWRDCAGGVEYVDVSETQMKFDPILF